MMNVKKFFSYKYLKLDVTLHLRCRLSSILRPRLFPSLRKLVRWRVPSTRMAEQQQGDHNGPKELVIVQEGKAKVGFKGPVFYNPVQEFNRDLTVSVLRQFVRSRASNQSQTSGSGGDGEPVAKKQKLKAVCEDGPIRILDALSASGLRAFRFSQEVENVDYVLANDFSENAVESIKENITLNGVEGKVRANFGDAVVTMMEHRNIDKRFHAVDLDPYGSASVFLDSAVQCVADRGNAVTILRMECNTAGDIAQPLCTWYVSAKEHNGGLRPTRNLDLSVAKPASKVIEGCYSLRRV
ncbi:hypothetical protein Y032_0054g2531 [Ancylostoma ceylanicum]|uniref:tRNA (guanine(26)-N(2))-dimethyltransferase n=1 Tax=Ancylostoma ceylanicum TaxID=53326 RepID=A0A016U5Z0_9BILA|nr:hypothetical protein Y032_0054g2531 [Ancylostoma ceylanicum]